MALLFVTEYESITPTNEGGAAQVPYEPAVVDQTPVAISATHAESAAFGKTTRYVRLHTDSICSVVFGPSPAATTNNQRMVAGQTEFKGVQPGYKVSVVLNT